MQRCPQTEHIAILETPISEHNFVMCNCQALHLKEESNIHKVGLFPYARC